MGWKSTLYKKVLGIYIPDTVDTVKFGHEYLVDQTINEWVDNLDIPEENVIIRK